MKDNSAMTDDWKRGRDAGMQGQVSLPPRLESRRRDYERGYDAGRTIRLEKQS